MASCKRCAHISFMRRGPWGRRKAWPLLTELILSLLSPYQHLRDLLGALGQALKTMEVGGGVDRHSCVTCLGPEQNENMGLLIQQVNFKTGRQRVGPS